MAKYSRKASKKVADAMRRRKKGTLESGSGRKVKSRKQAVAIGLSEARRSGAKVPPPESASASTKKTKGTRKTKATKKSKGTKKKAATKKR